MPTVKQLYQEITGDLLTHQRTIAAQLAREAKARRRLVSLYSEGLSDRQVGERTRSSYGAPTDY